MHFSGSGGSTTPHRESEAERKVSAKVRRASRRSTQGVTAEQLGEAVRQVAASSAAVAASSSSADDESGVDGRGVAAQPPPQHHHRLQHQRKVGLR